MRIDITEKNMVWLVEHKMADTIVAEFHRKETVIESLIRERDEARAEVKRLEAEPEDGWVLWEDYERLRAELTTLRASSFVTAVPVEEYEKLKAEVERLKEGNECLNQMHEKEMARSAYLCEQVERLRKAGDWQPIETAPKDGTAVLIYCQVSGAVEAHWDCEWLDRHNDACDIYEVTHWTQLTKPAAKEGKQS